MALNSQYKVRKCYDFVFSLSHSSQSRTSFVTETLGRLSTDTDAVKAVASSDLVIEAIVENIEVKRKLFSSLDKAAPA